MLCVYLKDFGTYMERSPLQVTNVTSRELAIMQMLFEYPGPVEMFTLVT